MVEVFFPPPERSRLRLRVTGHCGAAGKGKDLVCAAVSSLVQTMVGGMEKEVQASVEGTFEEGICDVQVVVNESREPELAAIARVFRFGFEKLAREHPTHIRIVN
ncbi:MAG: ribosomal-processing cysteine protease Prp [Candidatus Riflebacteria bacterium]|nr:ribosomal-processing cysteine protease Prp [Candidatus Riflebacteria bacterium]